MSVFEQVTRERIAMTREVIAAYVRRTPVISIKGEDFDYYGPNGCDDLKGFEL